ncbi:MAG: formyltransferase family protein [Rikenellaceae bacterium]
MKEKKDYIIYCSGNASRVIRFFQSEDNLTLYPPKLVIFDGDNELVLIELKSLFNNKLYWINYSSLSEDNKKRIHTYTSNLILLKMKEYAADYFICFGSKIMKKELISAYPNRLINFHPSILPAFKGKRAIDQALEKNAGVLGNTAHYINEQIDEGEIIIQSSMLTSDFTDYEDVLELQLPMIKIILRDLLNYKIPDEEVCSELKNRRLSYLLQTKIQNKNS